MLQVCCIQSHATANSKHATKLNSANVSASFMPNSITSWRVHSVKHTQTITTVDVHLLVLFVFILALLLRLLYLLVQLLAAAQAISVTQGLSQNVWIRRILTRDQALDKICMVSQCSCEATLCRLGWKTRFRNSSVLSFAFNWLDSPEALAGPR